MRRAGRTVPKAVSLSAAAALTTAALFGSGPAQAAPTTGPHGAGGSGSGSGRGTPRLRVLNYNAFLMSRNLYPNWGQDHRAREIPRADWFQGNDVVVLEEAFDNRSSADLKHRAADRYPHQTPVVGRSKDGWDATGGAYSGAAPEDGGVTLLSRWPVLHQEQYIYSDACGSDASSNKGFLYAVLNVDGTRVHVVGTHTQSTDGGCRSGEAAADRAKQFRQIDDFLDDKHIPASEQVLLAGDLNVDAHGSEHSSMLRNAGVEAADSRDGHPYSFDTEGNTVAAERYPDDPSEDLDYVLHRKGHARPAQWHNRVLPERSAPWTVTSWGREYTYRNLSDHYPLTAG